MTSRVINNIEQSWSDDYFWREKKQQQGG